MSASPLVKSPKEHLLALLESITSATHTIINEYEKRGFDVPALDSTDAHPMDAQVTPVALKESIQLLENACGELCSTVARPGQVILQRGLYTYDSVALRVALKANIANEIARNPSGVHLRDLAKFSNIKAEKLGSIMRLLAVRNCFREVEPDVFVNNRLSTVLLSTNPVSHALDLATNMAHTKATPTFYEALIDPVYGPTYEADKSPIMYALRKEGFQGTYYDYLKDVAGRQLDFNMSVMGFGNATGHLCVVDEFPWKDLPQGSMVVDLGCGAGSISMALLRRHSQIQVTLHDLPQVINNTRLYWNRENNADVDKSRVTFAGINFFEQSPVAGASMYYLSQCLHNWSDEDSVVILKKIRPSMTADSRLLIHENIVEQLDGKKFVPHEGFSDETPSSPALTSKRWHTWAYYQDVNMLNVCNSRERRVEEFVALAKQADMELVKVWDFVESALLEFRAV